LKGLLTSWVSVTKTRNIPWRSSWQMDSTRTRSSNWWALLAWRWRSFVSLLEWWPCCLTMCQSMINTWAVSDSTLLWWPCLLVFCPSLLSVFRSWLSDCPSLYTVCLPPRLLVFCPSLLSVFPSLLSVQHSRCLLILPSQNGHCLRRNELPKSTICLPESTICPTQLLSFDSPLSKWTLS
jgi:hypothetical protein